MQGIYCIEHRITGRKYYGSSMNVSKRLQQHKTDLSKNKHHNIQLQRAYTKHGIEQFTFYLVEETNFTDTTELLAYEQTFLDSNKHGYNMAPANGGDTLSNHPNKIEIRKQINETHQKTMENLSATERKLKFGKSGNSNPNWKNGGISSKICPNCGITRISSKSTACTECRDRTGTNNPFYGKHHSETTKQILREKNSGDNSWIKGVDPRILPYTQIYEIRYPSGQIKQIAGLKAIAQEFNTSIPNIHNTIKRIQSGNIPKRGKLAGISIKAKMAV